MTAGDTALPPLRGGPGWGSERQRAGVPQYGGTFLYGCGSNLPPTPGGPSAHAGWALDRGAVWQGSAALLAYARYPALALP